MAEESKIEWTDHTWNPWEGCTKVSPACTHCYADAVAKRQGLRVWGKGVPRYKTKQQTWEKPNKWNMQAKLSGIRPRIFSLSMGDIFDEEVDPKWREDAFGIIERCDRLDWLLLTKRIELANSMLPDDFGKAKWRHVWIGTTVETQKYADQRIPQLQKVPATIRFLSVEPLLGPIEFKSLEGIHWVIVGGESGPGHRPMEKEWVESIRQQCEAAGVAFFFKQWGGSTPKKNGRELNGKTYSEIPASPAGLADEKRKAAQNKRAKKARKKNVRVTISNSTAKKLEAMAQKSGLTTREYLEGLIKKA